ncbi:MAG TPA: hypothetical protein VGX28_17010 [Frankiaceae bacterium]|jgi:hypothetical protein|nr:hypothetical protein [Frankiaceae bacterium]
MRLARLLSVPAVALTTVCALVSPVSASGDGVVTDVLGSIVVADFPSTSSQLSASCNYTRTSAGAGGAGTDMTFTVAAEATAIGTYKSVEIVATAVSCNVYKPDMVLRTGEQWYPGQAAVATANGSSEDATFTAVCVTVAATLRNVPVGESDNLISYSQCKSA